MKRRTALGFNILRDRVTAKANVTEANSVMLKSFLDFLRNDAKKSSYPNTPAIAQ
jgi:hypothetical protein